MDILGIETSCDDTSIAIVRDGTKVLSHVTASQVDVHAKTGGVVPEIAAREHANIILPVLQNALRRASLCLHDLDAIAVTQGPGLVSSLLIGDLVASTIGLILEIPLSPVHHIEAHIYSNWLERDPSEFHFPIMILTASGGHNELILMRGHGTYYSVGHTRDDAAGEAFDKVARIIGLGYPGGPAISLWARKGDSTAFKLPRSMLGGSMDFSFSGLKSEIVRIVEKEIQIKKRLSDRFVADIAASFQECVVDILATKLMNAARQYGVREIHLAGGVSANKSLQRRMLTLVKQGKWNLKYPCKTIYSTDNGAMVAVCGYYRMKKGCAKYLSSGMILPDPHLSFSPWSQ